MFGNTRTPTLWLRHLGGNTCFLVVLLFHNVDRHLHLFTGLHLLRENNFKDLKLQTIWINLIFWKYNLNFLLLNCCGLFSELQKGAPWGEKRVMPPPSASSDSQGAQTTKCFSGTYSTVGLPLSTQHTPLWRSPQDQHSSFPKGIQNSNP